VEAVLCVASVAVRDSVEAHLVLEDCAARQDEDVAAA
jgi:hypothetical protein